MSPEVPLDQAVASRAERKPRFPNIDRKYILLYLLDTCGSLTKAQIDRIAATLEEHKIGDPPQSSLTTLDKLRDAAGSSSAKDAQLDHLALGYTARELQKRKPFPDPGEMRSFVDTWAGHGTSRILITELYSLNGLGDVDIRGGHTYPVTDDVLFYPTAGGRDFAKALRNIFQRTEWGEYVAIADRDGLRAQPNSLLKP